MLRKNLFKFSLVTLALGILILLLSYFCFHYVTDDGITLTWHPEAGKPYVTILIGIFGVIFMGASALSALFAALVLPKDEEKK